MTIDWEMHHSSRSRRNEPILARHQTRGNAAGDYHGGRISAEISNVTFANSVEASKSAA